MKFICEKCDQPCRMEVEGTQNAEGWIDALGRVCAYPKWREVKEKPGVTDEMKIWNCLQCDEECEIKLPAGRVPGGCPVVGKDPCDAAWHNPPREKHERNGCTQSRVSDDPYIQCKSVDYEVIFDDKARLMHGLKASCCERVSDDAVDTCPGCSGRHEKLLSVIGINHDTCPGCIAKKKEIERLKAESADWEKTAGEISDRSSRQFGEIEDLKAELERDIEQGFENTIRSMRRFGVACVALGCMMHHKKYPFIGRTMARMVRWAGDCEEWRAA